MSEKNFFDELAYLKDHCYDYQKSVAEKIKSHNLPVIIFGAAQLAKRVAKVLEKFGVKISGYAVDGNYFTPNKTLNDLPIFNFDELYKTPEKYVFVPAVGSLLDNGKRRDEFINDKKIIQYDIYLESVESIPCDYILENREKFVETYNLLADDFSKKTLTAYLKAQITNNAKEIFEVFTPNQYFNETSRPILSKGGGIGFVDCGAFIGDTVENFIKFSGGNYKKIFAVEPDEKNFEKLKNLIREKNYKNIEIFNCGAWDKKDTLIFQNKGNSSASISQSGDIKISVDSIDNIVGEEKIDFIKMDIEGSELKALNGALKTLKKFSPALAVCVYHKKEDLITIPQFLKNLNLDYDFYLRHHSRALTELVLYAIPK